MRRRGHDRLDRRRAVVLRQVRVAHGHADILVAEELLHRPEIARSHHDPGRKGVPEIVPVEVPNARALDRLLEPSPPVLLPPAIRAVIGDHRLALPVHQPPDRLRRHRREFDLAIPLLAVDQNHAALEIDVMPREPELLAAPRARIQREIELRLVFLRFGIVLVQVRAEPRFLVLRQPARAPWRFIRKLSGSKPTSRDLL